MDFYIMSKDIPTAKYQDNNLEAIKPQLMPLYLQYTSNVEKWLEIRAIDCHRTNSRLLKKALRLTEKDDVSTALSVNAVTITDNYWVKPLDSDLKYSDVRFDNDYFSNLALNGNYDSFNGAFNKKTTRSPELTNIGSFEKCWKLRNGNWWMYKQANHDEMFSELFICNLGKKLGFNMAEYQRGNKVIKTKDFTENAAVNYEPAYSFSGDDEDYIKTLNILKNICPQGIADYVKMIFMDTVCANPDRHTFNYGIIRNVDTGKILGLAPNFDNNMALISRGYPKTLMPQNDMLINLFNELTRYDETLKKYIPEINEKIIKEVIASTHMRVKGKLIIEYIMNRYSLIEK